MFLWFAGFLSQSSLPQIYIACVCACVCVSLRIGGNSRVWEPLQLSHQICLWGWWDWEKGLSWWSSHPNRIIKGNTIFLESLDPSFSGLYKLKPALKIIPRNGSTSSGGAVAEYVHSKQPQLRILICFLCVFHLTEFTHKFYSYLLRRKANCKQQILSFNKCPLRLDSVIPTLTWSLLLSHFWFWDAVNVQNIAWWLKKRVGK